jgi:hypothetical protein
MCICVIFQFKTGVKLKWGCVKSLVQSNFRWLGKNRQKYANNISGGLEETTENRPKIFSADKEFLAVSVKISVRNKIIFGGHILTAENCVMFGGHS